MRPNGWMAEKAPMVASSCTSQWPASVALLAKIVRLPDLTVVRDVRIDHQQVVVADRSSRRRRGPCRGGSW
jgi:hypothetical protein